MFEAAGAAAADDRPMTLCTAQHHQYLINVLCARVSCGGMQARIIIIIIIISISICRDKITSFVRANTRDNDNGRNIRTTVIRRVVDQYLAHYLFENFANYQTSVCFREHAEYQKHNCCFITCKFFASIHTLSKNECRSEIDGCVHYLKYLIDDKDRFTAFAYEIEIQESQIGF